MRTTIVAGIYNRPQELKRPVNKEKMSRLVNKIVLVHRSENMVMKYESRKGSTVLLVPIRLVTSGGYRGFQQSQVKYKWLDSIIKHVAQGDK